MSRSRRRPYSASVGCGSTGLRWWKRSYNRHWRRIVRQALAQGEEVLPDRHDEVANEWAGPRDGRQSYVPAWGYGSARFLARVTRK